MKPYHSWFECIRGCGRTYSIYDVVYRCEDCGGLLDVEHDLEALKRESAVGWKAVFEQRARSIAWPYNSGIWGITMLSGNYSAHETVWWEFWCIDAAGNANWSVNVSSTVNNQPPTLTSITANISAAKLGDWIRITTSGASDNDGSDTYALICSNTTNGPSNLCAGMAGTGFRPSDYSGFKFS